MSNTESDEKDMERVYNSRDRQRINDYRLGFRQGIRAAAEMARTISADQNLETLLLQKFNIAEGK